MKSCLLCPRGTGCKGYVLNTLVVKIYNILIAHKGEDAIEAIVHDLSREDLEILASYGDQARSTCWNKGFVMAVAHILTFMVGKTKQSDIVLRARIEEMLRLILRVCAKLPKGIKIDLQELSMDIYNRAIELLQTSGSPNTLPLTVYGQAFASVMRARAQAAAH